MYKEINYIWRLEDFYKNSPQDLLVLIEWDFSSN